MAVISELDFDAFTKQVMAYGLIYTLSHKTSSVVRTLLWWLKFYGQEVMLRQEVFGKMQKMTANDVLSSSAKGRWVGQTSGYFVAN